MTIDCGDDFISTKSNSSNILIQDSHFRRGTGVAIGSVGQLPGVYEFVENVTAERISCDKCQFAAYVKTWTGIEQGVPPNGIRTSIGVDEVCTQRTVLLFCRWRRRLGVYEEHKYVCMHLYFEFEIEIDIPPITDKK